MAPFSSSGVHELTVFLRGRSVSSYISQSSVPADADEPFPVLSFDYPSVIARTYYAHYVGILVSLFWAVWWYFYFNFSSCLFRFIRTNFACSFCTLGVAWGWCFYLFSSPFCHVRFKFYLTFTTLVLVRDSNRAVRLILCLHRRFRRRALCQRTSHFKERTRRRFQDPIFPIFYRPNCQGIRIRFILSRFTCSFRLPLSAINSSRIKRKDLFSSNALMTTACSLFRKNVIIQTSGHFSIMFPMVFFQ